MEFLRIACGKLDVIAVRDDRMACPVLEFLDDVTEAERKKVVALFDYTADYGPPDNKEKFKPIHRKRGAYEFRTHESRIFCFLQDQRVVLTHGKKKKAMKGTKAYAAAEDHVLDVRTQYRQAVAGRGIRISELEEG